MCLPTCPTYQLTGLEINSPRGRIHMIRAIADGQMDISAKFKESISFCLNCQACVTACPAGVEYGQLVEAAQLQIAASERAARGKSGMRQKILDWLFLDLRRLQFAGKLLRWYQISGLEKLLQKTGLLRLVSKRMHELIFMPPPVSKRSAYQLNKFPDRYQEKPVRVGILKGCVQDLFFRDVNQDTIDVLERNGYEVFIPAQDICCGSVHGHNGNLETARHLARQLIDIFTEAGVDYVILNSAGCGAYMKEYKNLFIDDEKYQSKAASFSDKVKDIMEFLHEKGWKRPQKVHNLSVTYHDPCHLIHTQKIAAQPRAIINSIKGITYTELNEAGWCCGSAGIYNIIRYDDSMKVLERKIDNIRASGAKWIVTGNPGCMIQLMYGIQKYNLDMKVIHPVSLLNLAYQMEGEIN
jgi:glycolate oxidase iron-sulfur subunit